MTTFRDLLRQSALRIYPYKSLDELTRRGRSEQDTIALVKIMAEGGEFLDPYWISCYWPISASALYTIRERYTQRLAA